jgi:hypothetical protein
MTRHGETRARFVRLAAVIRADMERLASVVAEAELALADFAEATPPLRELRGIGAIVHDFYTGPSTSSNGSRRS